MALSISGLLAGASKRIHEHQLMEYQDEQARRRELLDHYSKSFESTPYGSVKQKLADEMSNVLSASPDKAIKPKPIPAPTPEEIAQAAGTSVGPNATPAAAGAGATPPPIDAHMIIQAAHAATGGGAPGADQITPPDSSAAGPQPTNTDAPAMQALLAQAGGAPARSANLPSAAATPPGHNAPEASPLVGSIPGMTPPALAGAGAGAGAPPPPPQSAPPMSAQLTPPSMTAFPGAIDMGRIKGEAAAAALAPQAAFYQRYGLGPTGKVVISAHDVASAADKGRTFVRDENGMIHAVPMSPDQYTALQQQKLALDGERSRYLTQRGALADAQAELARAGNDPKSPKYALAMRKLNVEMERLGVMQNSYLLRAQRFDADMRGTINGVPIAGGPTDAQGNPIGIKIATLMKPPAMTQNRADTARAAIGKGEGIIQLLQGEVAKETGPFTGTLNELLLKHGFSDADVAGLDAAMYTWASMQPALHGMRSGALVQHYYDRLSLRQPAENLLAVANEYQDTAQRVAALGSVSTTLRAGANTGANTGASAGSAGSAGSSRQITPSSKSNPHPPIVAKSGPDAGKPLIWSDAHGGYIPASAAATSATPP